MPDASPTPWLTLLEGDLGLEEISGAADNPKIVAKAAAIARAFPNVPGFPEYCALYQHDDTAWCGLEMGWAVAMVGIMPPFDRAVQTRSLLWAQAWKSNSWRAQRLSGPRVGAIAVLARHVTCVARIVDANTIECIGGNQATARHPQGGGVTRSRVSIASVEAFMWPADAATDLPLQTTDIEHPLIMFGSVGPAVEELQRLLGFTGGDVDGAFGEQTDAAVRAYQAAHGLEVDGEVGELTWAALLGKPARPTDETLPAKYLEYRAGYASDWKRMSIEADKVAAVDAIARRCMANKARYQAAGAKTGVPWFVIAALHDRESSGDFSTQLAQGDPLNRVSTHVPSGRGPFASWEDGAYDALVTLKDLNSIRDWPIERIAYECERYNGWGYRNHGIPSAYVWSFSNIYRGGKYIADGVWSATAMDKQCGTLPLIKRIAELDQSVTLCSYQDAPPPVEPPDEETDEPADPDDAVILPPLKLTDAEKQLLRAIVIVMLYVKETDMASDFDASKLRALLQELGLAPAQPPPPPPPPPPRPSKSLDVDALRALLQDLGLAPPAKALPPPAETKPAEPAAPPPVAADPAKPATPAATVDFRAGLVGVIGSALAWWTGMAGEGTAIATGAGSVIASALGIPAPLWAIGRSLLGRITLRPK